MESQSPLTLKPFTEIALKSIRPPLDSQKSRAHSALRRCSTLWSAFLQCTSIKTMSPSNSSHLTTSKRISLINKTTLKMRTKRSPSNSFAIQELLKVVPTATQLKLLSKRASLLRSPTMLATTRSQYTSPASAWSMTTWPQIIWMSVSTTSCRRSPRLLSTSMLGVRDLLLYILVPAPFSRLILIQLSPRLLSHILKNEVTKKNKNNFT